MPRLSDSMEEGTILVWMVSPGDTVEVGQEIAEIESAIREAPVVRGGEIVPGQARALGFRGFRRTDDTFRDTFAHLREARIIPR